MIWVSGVYLSDYTLHNLLSDHPNKSHTYLTPHIVIRVLLTLFTKLYFTSPWVFCNTKFILLNPLAFSFILPTPPIWQPSKCTLHLWVCFCSDCLFCFIDMLLIDIYFYFMDYIFNLFPFSLKRLFNISCNIVLVVRNSFSFFLSRKFFFFPLILNDSFAG